MVLPKQEKAFFSQKWINPDETKRETSLVLVEIFKFPVELKSNHDLIGKKS